LGLERDNATIGIGKDLAAAFTSEMLECWCRKERLAALVERTVSEPLRRGNDGNAIRVLLCSFAKI